MCTVVVSLRTKSVLYIIVQGVPAKAYTKLVQKTKLEKKKYHNSMVKRVLLQLFPNTAKTLLLPRTNAIIKEHAFNEGSFSRRSCHLIKKEYHDSLKEKKQIFNTTSLAQKLQKKYINLLARRMKTHYTDIL